MSGIIPCLQGYKKNPYGKAKLGGLLRIAFDAVEGLLRDEVEQGHGDKNAMIETKRTLGDKHISSIFC